MKNKTRTFKVIKDEQELPLVLTPMDVAKVLGVSRNTAYEVVHSKGFPAFKVGNQYRIQRDKLFQWMDENVA